MVVPWSAVSQELTAYRIHSNSLICIQFQSCVLFYFCFVLIDRMIRIQNITISDDQQSSWLTAVFSWVITNVIKHSPVEFRNDDGRHSDSFWKNHIFISLTVSFILTSYFSQSFVMLKKYVLLEVLQFPANKREHFNICLDNFQSRMFYKYNICSYCFHSLNK